MGILIEDRDKSFFIKEDETRNYFNDEIQNLRSEHYEILIRCLSTMNEILMKAVSGA